MREHSNAGQNARLPWDYDVATQAIGDKFLQLREELVPYLYTLSQQASATGIPMTQALYLDYPDQAGAYDYPERVPARAGHAGRSGDDPGRSGEYHRVVPARHLDRLVHRRHLHRARPADAAGPDDRMPVFVKEGGIVPLQPATGQAQSAGSAPLTLRVFDGASGQYSMYDDAGQGLGYQQGQFATTPISYTDNGAASSVVIGPASSGYPGAPAKRSYTVDLVDTTKPAFVSVDGKALAGSAWSYDSVTRTLQVPVPATPTGRQITITQTGGTAVTSGEPAATELTLSPSGSVVTTPGASTTVSATLANSGPGAASGVALNLSAPSGWTVTPTTPTTSASLGSGSSLTASWSVTAPPGPAGQTVSAALSASASYTDATTGQPVTLNTQQNPTPVITSVSPGTASTGQVVTVTGLNFGMTQGDSYITFSDDGTNWGAPPDEATFTLNSWGANSVTFTVPSPSGTGGEWHVVPGSTATVTVTTADGTSSPATLTIGS